MRLEKYPGQNFLYFNNTRAFAHEYIYWYVFVVSPV